MHVLCVYSSSHHKTRRISERRKVLFNDALNIFHLRLYGIKHMVKNHSDSERGNLLSPHGLLFPISSKGSFIYMHHPTNRMTHTTAFVTLDMDHWLEQEIAQWINLMTHRTMSEKLLPRSYISLSGKD